ncbi:MAG: hypothetical protein ACI8P3_000541 [Saprospiraceae bacterium]|jgi:hypothetical protein
MAYIDPSAVYENDVKRELFKTNLLTYSELIEKSNQAWVLFLGKAISCLKENGL